MICPATLLCVLSAACGALLDQPQEKVSWSPAERSAIDDPISGGAERNPGLKINIGKKGLEYANDIATGILNEELENLRIPNQHFDKTTLNNIKITYNSLPKYKVDVGEENIRWRLNEGVIGLKADFLYETHIHFFPKTSKLGGFIQRLGEMMTWTIEKGGHLIVDVGSYHLDMAMALSADEDGSPRMKGENCAASLADFGISLRNFNDGQDILLRLVNLFRRWIADQYRDDVEQMICRQALHFLNAEVNAKLKTFPTRSTLQDRYELDYRLKTAPRLGPSAISTEHVGRVRRVHASPANETTSPFAPHPFIVKTDSGDDNMLQILASDHLLNSFLQQAHQNQALRFVVNEQNQPNVMRYLRTTCADTDQCFGTIFKRMAEEYPNAKGEVVISAKTPPTIAFLKDHAIFKVTDGSFELSARTGENNTPLLSGDFSLEAEVHFDVTAGPNITASAKVISLDPKVALTEMPELLDGRLVRDLTTLITPVAEEVANGVLGQGIPVPLTRGVRLTKPRLSLQPRTLQIDADLEYRRN